MLTWAVIFLIVALVAGLLGLPGVAAVSIEISRILFFIFLVLFKKGSERENKWQLYNLFH